MNHDDFKIYRAIALFAYIQAHPDLAPETVSKRSGDISEACCRDDERRVQQKAVPVPTKNIDLAAWKKWVDAGCKPWDRPA